MLAAAKWPFKAFQPVCSICASQNGQPDECPDKDGSNKGSQGLTDPPI